MPDFTYANLRRRRNLRQMQPQTAFNVPERPMPQSQFQAVGTPTVATPGMPERPMPQSQFQAVGTPTVATPGMPERPNTGIDPTMYGNRRALRQAYGGRQQWRQMPRRQRMALVDRMRQARASRAPQLGVGLRRA